MTDVVLDASAVLALLHGEAGLALARRLGASVLTADRAWRDRDIGVPVELLR